MDKHIIGRMTKDRCYVCGAVGSKCVVRIDNDVVPMTVPTCTRCAMLDAAVIWDAVCEHRGAFIEARV